MARQRYPQVQGISFLHIMRTTYAVLYKHKAAKNKGFFLLRILCLVSLVFIDVSDNRSCGLLHTGSRFQYSACLLQNWQFYFIWNNDYRYFNAITDSFCGFYFMHRHIVSNVYSGELSVSELYQISRQFCLFHFTCAIRWLQKEFKSPNWILNWSDEFHETYCI
jgi:hypothetical protein